MFDCLLKQYKKDVKDVLDPDISSMIYEAVKGFLKKILTKLKVWKESKLLKLLKFLKRWKPYILIGMVALGMILSVVWQGKKWLSLFALVFVGICSFLLFNQNKSEEPIKAFNESAAKTRMEKMIDCLQKSEFNIDVNDEKKLNQLIERAERAQKEQDQKGLLWNSFGSVVAMIFTAFLPEFFKEIGWQTSIDIAIKSILICAMFLFFGGCLRDLFFSSEKQILDSFISDVEDIKLFPNKACSIIKDEEKRIKRKRKHQGKKIIKVLKSRFAGNTASERCEPDGQCVIEYEINVRKEWTGTIGDQQAVGHKETAERK